MPFTHFSYTINRPQASYNLYGFYAVFQDLQSDNLEVCARPREAGLAKLTALVHVSCSPGSEDGGGPVRARVNEGRGQKERLRVRARVGRLGQGQSG